MNPRGDRMKTTKVLMVLTNRDHYDETHPTGQWLEEFAEPYRAFLAAGYEVTLASPLGGRVPLDPVSVPDVIPEKWQAAYDALQSVAVLEEVASRDYDAVVIPGGHGPLFDLAVDPTLAQVLVRAKAKNRLIAAVCHGQAGLVSAKNEEGTSIFADYRVTGFSNREEEIAGLDKLVPFALETRLLELGTRYEAKEPWHPHVVVDRNLITGQNPQSSELFAKTIVEALA